LISLMTEPEALLREHGLQVTAQRLAVLRALKRRPHSTADHVADAVRAEIGAISRQAVYDALGQLTSKGLLRRVLLAGSPAFYELTIGDHHHAICRTCGKTVDVACPVGEAPRRAAAAESGFRIDAAEVVYWGTCPSCLGETPSAPSA
jgi:Fur family transcriptional regulator, stress-responsive regulator